eukprot:TRINITY_DN4874_c0_g1_i1.p1 TRINITY_DN4874_c0_g1~~TRINITY_DN4874_c0_g1_i1.p1  ORF type:complete len:278 (+),score=49.07 TRINITY_DN4874_c0_g1_i1:278-1111(+)
MARYRTNLHVKVCSGHQRPVPHIVYSRVLDDTYWFVSSCLDGKPMLRNGQNGDWVGTFEGHKGAVWMSCFNNDLTKLATGSGDYSAKIWNALDGSDLVTWPHPRCVKSVDWREIGGNSDIVTGSMDKTIRFYDVNRADAQPIVFEGHNGIVKSTLFYGTDSMFSIGTDNLLKRWDTRSMQAVRTTEIPDINTLEINLATNVLVVASKWSVTLVNPDSLAVERTFAQSEEVECAAMSPNGELFALGSKLKVKEFDRNTGAELSSPWPSRACLHGAIRT